MQESGNKTGSIELLNREFSKIFDEYKSELSSFEVEQDIRLVYSRYLGKEGTMRLLLSSKLSFSPKEEKKTIGELGNQFLNRAEKLFEERLVQLKKQERDKELSKQIDITLPGRSRQLGAFHPITLVQQEVESIFAELGFEVALGPQIESDFYNFEALGIPKNHPARSMQDTFYIKDSEYVLRTHTSPVQVRMMIEDTPPIRMIAPGKVYRREDDVTHAPMFNQIEGLWVDKSVNFSQLKGVLEYFAKKFFGADVVTRLRPSFFPFTEPSAELDILCFSCKGKEKTGCRICKGTGFVEILGCGMVDPEVFFQVEMERKRMQKPSINFEDYRGFAFGMGLDRLAMFRYGISNIRLLTSGDIRFGEQIQGVL